MKSIIIRELQPDDKQAFLEATNASIGLHHPWVKAPVTSQEFEKYLQRYTQPTHKSYLVGDESGKIAGLFNISEIVRGQFQNGYLGFYALSGYAGKGYMSAGLKLVLEKIFTDLDLHRIEANIQPDNTQSIALIKNNGFRKEGISPRYLKVNNEWRDHERWAMTIEDWVDIKTLRK